MCIDNFRTFRKEAKVIAKQYNVNVKSVKGHDPKWHEFGILKHSKKVFKNARRINQITGIDFVKIALWHDIGKIIARKVKSGGYTFKGHEEASANYLRDNHPYEFNEQELFLIKNHGVVRGDNSVESIVNLCNDDQDLLQKLVLLCAADTSGKGFTEAQTEQRNQLLEKFIQLSIEAGIDSNLINEIILEW